MERMWWLTTDKTTAALHPVMLPPEQQLVVGEVLQNATASYSEVPWRHSNEIGHYACPTDVQQRVLVELGITPPRAQDI